MSVPQPQLLLLLLPVCPPPPVCHQVVLPLELNTRVRCRWKDGEYYRCKLLERRILSEFNQTTADANPAAAWEYYVHFSGSECHTCLYSHSSHLETHTHTAAAAAVLPLSRPVIHPAHAMVVPPPQTHTPTAVMRNHLGMLSHHPLLLLDTS